MFDWLTPLFSSQSFMPHGHCYLWRPDVLWLNVGSDALIAAAYYSIPISLVYFVRKRKDIPFNLVLLMFAAFILACGTTHIIEIWTVWHPAYGLQGVVKLFTAVISVATAIALWPLMPHALAIPSARRLEAVISQLQVENAERKAAESRLRETEQRLSLLIEGVKDYAIFMLGTDGTVTTWNSGASKIYGYQVDEVLGTHISRFYSENDQKNGAPERELRTAAADGRYEEEGLRVRKDGTTYIANVVVTALRDAHDVLIGFSKVTRDITEKKRGADQLKALNDDLERRVEERTKALLEREEQLIKARDAAHAASAAKSAFLANMSHEIRTPLGAVLGFADLLLNYDQSISERQSCIDAIKRNGSLLSQIINDILDLSKIEAGRLEVERMPIATKEILSDLTALLSLQAAEKGIKLVVVAEGAIPESIITDPLRLKQILLNVAGNAIKFTTRGTVDITVKQIGDSSGASKLAFIVKDTGIGIEPEAAARLFESFSQGDASTTRRFGGTGLGLALSRRLATALGGNVELTQSVRGIGSVFTVTIDQGTSREILFEMSGRNPGTDRTTLFSQPEAEIRLDGVKILLAEDALDNQLLVTRYLKSAGVIVECAPNGREAVLMASTHTYDLILMDLQMPEMDGYQATSTLRAQGFDKPIIAFTAHAMREDRQRCLAEGFSEHVAKPVDRQRLLRAILNCRAGIRAV